MLKSLFELDNLIIPKSSLDKEYQMNTFNFPFIYQKNTKGLPFMFFW